MDRSEQKQDLLGKADRFLMSQEALAPQAMQLAAKPWCDGREEWGNAFRKSLGRATSLLVKMLGQGSCVSQ